MTSPPRDWARRASELPRSPRSPGSRWWRLGIALKRWVIRLAPPSTAVAAPRPPAERGEPNRGRRLHGQATTAAMMGTTVTITGTLHLSWMASQGAAANRHGSTRTDPVSCGAQSRSEQSIASGLQFGSDSLGQATSAW